MSLFRRKSLAPARRALKAQRRLAAGVVRMFRARDRQPLVLFFSEARLARSADGGWVALDGVNGDTQWSRYTLPHCRVALAARASEEIGEGDPITGVEVVPLPSYHGLKEAVLRMPLVIRAIVRAVRKSDVVVARVPGPVSTVAAVAAKLQRRPYVVEVVGDIYDVLSQGTVPGMRHAAPVARWITQQVCRKAIAARYVTQSTLQATYPLGGEATIGMSNVQIQDDHLADAPRDGLHHASQVRLLCVGSQEVAYKGHDVALEALRILREKNTASAGDQVSYTLTLIGDGRLHEQLKAKARELGVADAVVFAGQQPGERVRAAMQEADVYLQPSLTEGLPRVVIEAMAQALPAVGTRVGGIPELVAEKFLVAPGNAQALADAVEGIIEPSTYRAQSARSLREAKLYTRSELDVRFATWSQWIERIASQKKSKA